MPNYDYKCLECNIIFELFQKMTDEPLNICPHCGGKLKRLIGTGSGPIFKGTGFYQTDYKNKTKIPTKEISKSTSVTKKSNSTKE